MSDQPPQVEVDRIDSDTTAPRVACIVVDGVKCWVRAAERVGVAVARLEDAPVVTLALARTSMGIEAGLYLALTAVEARRMAASLIRSAGMVDQPEAPGATR